jgi:hypothetical protein
VGPALYSHRAEATADTSLEIRFCRLSFGFRQHEFPLLDVLKL